MRVEWQVKLDREEIFWGTVRIVTVFACSEF